MKRRWNIFNAILRIHIHIPISYGFVHKFSQNFLFEVFFFIELLIYFVWPKNCFVILGLENVSVVSSFYRQLHRITYDKIIQTTSTTRNLPKSGDYIMFNKNCVIFLLHLLKIYNFHLYETVPRKIFLYRCFTRKNSKSIPFTHVQG